MLRSPDGHLVAEPCSPCPRLAFKILSLHLSLTGACIEHIRSFGMQHVPPLLCKVASCRRQRASALLYISQPAGLASADILDASGGTACLGEGRRGGVKVNRVWALPPACLRIDTCMQGSRALALTCEVRDRSCVAPLYAGHSTRLAAWARPKQGGRLLAPLPKEQCCPAQLHCQSLPVISPSVPVAPPCTS